MRYACEHRPSAQATRSSTREIQAAERFARDIFAVWDLIVVGSHGHTASRRFLLGSVAEFVTRQADCSVAMIRATESS